MHVSLCICHMFTYWRFHGTFYGLEGHLGDFMVICMLHQNKTKDMPDLEMVMKKEMATDSKTEERELDTHKIFTVNSCQVYLLIYILTNLLT